MKEFLKTQMRFMLYLTIMFWYYFQKFALTKENFRGLYHMSRETWDNQIEILVNQCFGVSIWIQSERPISQVLHISKVLLSKTGTESNPERLILVANMQNNVSKLQFESSKTALKAVILNVFLYELACTVQ